MIPFRRFFAPTASPSSEPPPSRGNWDSRSSRTSWTRDSAGRSSPSTPGERRSSESLPSNRWTRSRPGTDLAVVIIPASSVPGAILAAGRAEGSRRPSSSPEGSPNRGGRGPPAGGGQAERRAVRHPRRRAELPGRELSAPRPLRVLAPDHPEGRHGHRVAERNRRGGPDRLGRRGEARLLGIREHGKPDRRGRGGPDRVLRRRSRTRR